MMFFFSYILCKPVIAVAFITEIQIHLVVIYRIQYIHRSLVMFFFRYYIILCRPAIPLVGLAYIYLWLCPYTKIEESFNIQAMHSLLYLRSNISMYDHHEFSGVVPRSFIGPIVISFLSLPGFIAINSLGLSKLAAQYLVRGTLAICVGFAYMLLKRTVSRLFGPDTETWFLYITLSQFHFVFYLSRPLPNIMILPLVLVALHAWFCRQYKLFIWCSAFAIIVFRVELAMFLGLILLFEMYHKRIQFTEVVTLSLPAGVFAVCSTVIVDSIFWKRLLWPEAEVFWFNVILNRSHEWGTSPFLWYFYSALPRALGTTIFLIPAALYFDSRVRRFLLPVIVYVFLYSFLPHKELRFIIYTFPLFNIAAAVFCSRIWKNRGKSLIHKIGAIGLVLHLAANFLFTAVCLTASMRNYPGADAIMRLHSLERNTSDVSVHVDLFAAQTGVSRFTELNSAWKYNTTEDLLPGSEVMLTFSHLIVEGNSTESSTIKPYIDSHDILDSIEGFSRLSFDYRSFPPIKFETKPVIFILRRKDWPSKVTEGNLI